MQFKRIRLQHGNELRQPPQRIDVFNEHLATDHRNHDDDLDCCGRDHTGEHRPLSAQHDDSGKDQTQLWLEQEQSHSQAREKPPVVLESLPGKEDSKQRNNRRLSDEHKPPERGKSRGGGNHQGRVRKNVSNRPPRADENPGIQRRGQCCPGNGRCSIRKPCKRREEKRRLGSVNGLIEHLCGLGNERCLKLMKPIEVVEQ